MGLAKIYFSIIMIIICETVADNSGDSVACISMLAKIFKLHEQPEKTLQWCFKRLYNDLTMESVKAERFNDEMQFSKEEMQSLFYETALEVGDDDLIQLLNDEIELSTEEMECQSEEYGQLYMNYLYEQVNKENIENHSVFCYMISEGMKQYEISCLENMRTSGNIFKQGSSALKVYLFTKTLDDFIQGSFPYIYYMYVYETSSQSFYDNTMTPYAWCANDMYLPANSPRNIRRRERRAEQRNRSSSKRSKSSQNVIYIN